MFFYFVFFNGLSHEFKVGTYTNHNYYAFIYHSVDQMGQFSHQKPIRFLLLFPSLLLLSLTTPLHEKIYR